MPEQTAPGGAFVWSVEGRSIRITLTADVLASIGRAAQEGLEKVPRRGLEVGGVLLGVRQGDELTVTDWRPIACEHARGPGFELSANDEAALRQLLDSLAADPDFGDRQILGWFHTHTRDGICLTKTDLDLYNRFFPAPWQVALVVKPHPQQAPRAGFFFREPSGAIRSESSYREFVIEGGRRTAAPVGFDPTQLGGRAPQATEPARAGEALQAARRREPSPPAEARRIARRRLRLKWLAPPALGLAGAALFFGLPLLAPGPQPAAIGLEVRTVGDGLVVEWERPAALLEDASGATLIVEDGGERHTIGISPEDLRAGSLTFYRRTGEVTFRLEWQRPSGPPIPSSAHFSGPPPAATPGPAPVEDPAELERIEREIDALRSRLERDELRLGELRREIAELERQRRGAGPRRAP
jgi:proteasome lid subunit RPN8/RPN11